MQTELQAFVTGALSTALLRRDFMSVDVAMATDEHGNYEPWFFVTGQESGERLKVSVEVVTTEEGSNE